MAVNIHSAELALFMDRLMSISLDSWHQMAVASMDQSREPQSVIAPGALDARVSAFEVWRARDNVETALHRFESAEGRTFTRRPGDLMRIRRATECAALAVLARDTLTAQEFTEMVGGFSVLVLVETPDESVGR
ncbi:MAG TPA: hypothetical protein VF929_10450 [Gemmatimonadaceae bacterium]